MSAQTERTLRELVAEWNAAADAAATYRFDDTSAEARAADARVVRLTAELRDRGAKIASPWVAR